MRYASSLFSRKMTGVYLVLALLFAVTMPATAAVPETGKAVSYSSSLSRFMAADEQIMLRNASSEYVLFVPVSSRWQVQRASLHLEFTNSIALLPNRSQLIISLNRKRVAQVPLRATSPDGSIDVRLPAELMTEGYNQLKFEVAQHYTEDCEDPTSPELWTQLDTLASRLDIDVGPRVDAFRLSQLSRLFDRRTWGEFPLNIVSPPDTAPEQLLRWGGLVSQAAALRLDYVPLQVQYLPAERGSAASAGQTTRRLPGLQQTTLRGRDAVLIGTKTSLAPYIGDANAQRITGGFLGVFPMDDDPQRFVLVVSGTNDDEVTRAATALGFVNFPYADAATMNVAAFSLSGLASHSAPGAVREGGRYRFADLGFDGVTLHGFRQSNLNRARLTFWLPPDFYATEHDDIVLSLHMVYGAGLREDSVFNVFLNDRFESVIPLNDKNGAMFRDYKVRIPARSFRPGNNVISFEPRMTSLVSDHCKLGQSDNMLITLFGDSTLHMPGGSHYAALPDLSLLSRAGFPYTRDPSGKGIAVQVAGNDPATLAAAWTVMGRVAQSVGIPLYETPWSFTAPSAAADVLVIGAQSQLSDDLRRAAPMGLSSEASALYESRLSQDQSLSWWQRWWPWAEQTSVVRPAMAEVQQTGSLGRYTALTQFESPQHAGSTVTLLTAIDSQTLAAGANALVRPAVWSNLQGATTVWLGDGSDVQTQKTDRVYHSGSIDPATRLEYYFSNYPLYGSLALVLIIAALALLTWFLLQRFRRRHHPTITHSG